MWFIEFRLIIFQKIYGFKFVFFCLYSWHVKRWLFFYWNWQDTSSSASIYTILTLRYSNYLIYHLIIIYLMCNIDVWSSNLAIATNIFIILWFRFYQNTLYFSESKQHNLNKKFICIWNSEKELPVLRK